MKRLTASQKSSPHQDDALGPPSVALPQRLYSSVFSSLLLAWSHCSNWSSTINAF